GFRCATGQLGGVERLFGGAYVLSLMRNVGWVVLGWLCSLGCTSLNAGADERLFGSVEPTLAHGGAAGSPTTRPPAAGAAGATGAAGAPPRGRPPGPGGAGGAPRRGGGGEANNGATGGAGPHKRSRGARARAAR